MGIAGAWNDGEERRQRRKAARAQSAAPPNTWLLLLVLLQLLERPHAKPPAFLPLFRKSWHAASQQQRAFALGDL